MLQILPEPSRPQIDFAILDRIEGWLHDDGRDAALSLIEVQHYAGTLTAALEFGVHKGKFLALLAATHPLAIGVDALLYETGEPLPECYRVAAMEEIGRNVESVAGKRPRLYPCFTQDIDADALLRLAPSGFSFIHVDGGHDEATVRHDIVLAERLLSRGGIVAMDDYDSGHVGVTKAVDAHLANSELRPIAFTGNKLFLARPGNI